MTLPTDRPEAAVVVAFLQQYLQDQAASAVRSLADYQTRYPGYEAAVAREYDRLQSRASSEVGAAAALLDRVATRSEAMVDPEITLGEPGSSVLTSLESRGARGERYRDGTELGRGGMGIVRQVWDPDLRRSVAMKVLHAEEVEGSDGRRLPDPQALTRFLEEAQITGQLEHPGICPVHELGLDPDGRVYFTMSQVRGSNLREIIGRVQRGEGDWTQTRALGVILRVCEAIAFAHSKGVIHRDLKPSNVMVGRFGETYVMDWGLARVLGRDDHRDIRLRDEFSEPMSSVRSVRRDVVENTPDSPLVTMDGDVVGTPAYMAPEQALGRVDHVGPRADVYAIGAMLYHLLTGQMPFVPDGARMSSRTVLARVVEGPPQPVHELAPDVAAELVAICGKAMAREFDDRYSTVEELASDLRAFLEMRVVHAYRTGAVAELTKWVRRNKMASLASAAALMALMALLVFTRIEKRRADDQAQRAEASFQLAFDAAERLLAEAGMIHLRDVPRMDPARQALIRAALGFHERFVELRGDDPAVREAVAFSHFRHGYLHAMLGETDAMTEELALAQDIYAELIAENPERDDLRLRVAEIRTDLGIVLQSHNQLDAAAAELRAAQLEFDELAKRNPQWATARSDRAINLDKIGQNFQNRGQTEEALRCYRQSVAQFEQLVDDEPDDHRWRQSLGTSRQNLALLTAKAGQLDDAKTLAQTAVADYETVLQRQPNDRNARYSLAKCYANIALFESKSDDPEAALEMFELALQVYRKLVAQFPGVRNYHGELGGTLTNMTPIFAKRGDFERARELLEEAIEHKKIALAIDPGHVQFQRYMRIACSRLGSVLLQQREYREVGAHAEVMVKLLPTDGECLWVAGAILARAIGPLMADRSVNPRERQQLRDSYAARCVELLRESVKQGFPDTQLVHKPAFNSVRNDAAFAEFVRELENTGGR